MNTPVTTDDDRIEGLRTRAVRVVRESTGLHEQFAVRIADAIVEAFRAEFGGERIYLPTRDSARREKVVAQFNGRNRDDLLREFGISKSTFYRFLQMRKASREEEAA